MNNWAIENGIAWDFENNFFKSYFHIYSLLSPFEEMFTSITINADYTIENAEDIKIIVDALKRIGERELAGEI